MKLLLLVAGAGYLLSRFGKQIASFVDNLRVFISQPGTPTIEHNSVILPIIVRLENHEPMEVTVQNILVTVYYDQGNQNWVFLASSKPQANGSFIIKGNSSNKLKIMVGIPFSNMLQLLWIQFGNATKILENFKKMTLMVETKVKIGGRTFTQKEVFNQQEKLAA
ncbi:hypothetical protein [Flexithrix dorotheae]|uniref:hypothetical protein n=1 Tax=Flexithrix dorotheae TaxID=70993 RepID=UPI00037C38C1|nr:hypothetical protein [Flexithrix dorotheae]